MLLYPAMQDSDDGMDANLVSLLSLKLLLLAFFILLNGISQFEVEKTRAVLESVNAVFNGRFAAIPSTGPEPVVLAPFDYTDGALGDIGQLFRATLPAARVEITARGPALRIELSAGSLFRPGRAELQPGRGLLLGRLASALIREQAAGQPLVVELLHGLPSRGMHVVADAGPRALELLRAGLFAREMTGRGLAPDALSVGVVPNKPGVIQILIRLDKADPPLPAGQAIGWTSPSGRPRP